MLERTREEMKNRTEINPYVNDLAAKLMQSAAVAELNFDSDGWQLVTEVLSYAASAEQRIDEQERRISDLEQLSVTDELTGLPNLRGLRTAFGREVSLAARSHGYGIFAFIDLDGFKAINDTHGHMAGDRALRHVARELRRHVRPSDTVARIAGDEFAVLLPKCDEYDGAIRVEALRKALQSIPLHLEDGTILHLSCSIGMQVYSGASDPLTIIQAADQLMYQDKRRRTGL